MLAMLSMKIRDYGFPWVVSMIFMLKYLVTWLAVKENRHPFFRRNVQLYWSFIRIIIEWWPWSNYYSVSVLLDSRNQSLINLISCIWN